MINRKHKKAFSMVTAIFVIFVMASVSALIMNVTGKTIKATTQQYQKEQAQLLARSYTELAILYVLHYDRATGGGSCLETISDHFGPTTTEGYDVRMEIQYIGNTTLLPAGCGTRITPWVNTALGFDNTVSMIIDTYIRYRAIDHPLNQNAGTADDVFKTFHRRTLQKL
jgi:type II secretory pathway pseudopilin PulG